MKYLILLIIGTLVWLAWKKQSGLKSKAENRPSVERDAESMVACGHCGVYLPQGEAVEMGGVAYCCEAHRRLGPHSG